jgi:hypothetical protein
LDFIFSILYYTQLQYLLLATSVISRSMRWINGERGVRYTVPGTVPCMKGVRSEVPGTVLYLQCTLRTVRAVCTATTKNNFKLKNMMSSKRREQKASPPRPSSLMKYTVPVIK